MKVDTDREFKLSEQIIRTHLRQDLIIYPGKTKQVITLELTATWGENTGESPRKGKLQRNSKVGFGGFTSRRLKVNEDSSLYGRFTR